MKITLKVGETDLQKLRKFVKAEKTTLEQAAEEAQERMWKAVLASPPHPQNQNRPPSFKRRPLPSLDEMLAKLTISDPGNAHRSKKAKVT